MQRQLTKNQLKMNNTEFIYFFLGALSLFVGILVHNPLKKLWHAIKSWIFHRKPQQNIQSQIDEIREQLASRDRNRTYNIRRDVREYLKEIMLTKDNK